MHHTIQLYSALLYLHSCIFFMIFCLLERVLFGFVYLIFCLHCLSSAIQPIGCHVVHSLKMYLGRSVGLVDILITGYHIIWPLVAPNQGQCCRMSFAEYDFIHFLQIKEDAEGSLQTVGTKWLPPWWLNLIKKPRVKSRMYCV